MTTENANKILTYLLRPVARFCLRQGLKIQEIESAMKNVLLDEARSQIHREESATTVSRLSSLTGIARKLVPPPGHKAVETLSIVTRIIDRWQSRKPYVDPQGHAKALTVIGDNSEFAALVRQVTTDINPYTVLRELERLRLVERIDDKLRLSKSMALTKDVDQVFSLVSADLDTLVRATEHNVSCRDGDEHLHLSTSYDNIPLKHAEKVRKWMLLEGSKFHARAREFLRKLDRDSAEPTAKDPGRYHVTLGTQSFVEDITDVERTNE